MGWQCAKEKFTLEFWRVNENLIMLGKFLFNVIITDLKLIMVCY